MPIKKNLPLQSKIGYTIGMNSLYWEIGDVRITQILEIMDDGEDIQEGLPQATKENLLKIPWLQPHFVDDTGKFKAQVSVFLVETKDSRIIIDTGVGNDKERKSFAVWNNLHTNFLERFEKYGCPREKVDFVLCTHLHFDHVGWNTMLVNSQWIPTFPHARYLFLEKEFTYWRSFPAAELAEDIAGIKDSVIPVYEAGLVDLINIDYQITPEITLIPTPGHTPGHVSVLIKSGNKKAVISGDALHHPCQLVHPEWETTFDTDKLKAKDSRIKLLNQFVDTDTLFIGSHFAPPTAGYLRRESEGFHLYSKQKKS